MGEKKLIEILRKKEKEDKLFSKLEKIKAKAKPKLEEIDKIFPEYTIHDIRHSEKVLEILDEVVIPDSLKQKMVRYEIFFLIASAYLHDIGMVDFPELRKKYKEKFEKFTKEEKLKEPEISKKEVKRRFIRENHHLRSEEYIKEHFPDLEIENMHQARIIGRICKGHRKEDLNDKNSFKIDTYTIGVEINVPMLSAFLRIADELHIEFERAPFIIYEVLKPKDPISKEEWEKNQNVSGVTRLKEDLSQIKVTATCKSPKIHRALKGFEIKVQDELLKLPDYLHSYKDFYKELPVRIDVDITPEGYKPYDIKFSLKEREITQLLMGEKLYEQKGASLRELLQNSVDACRMRRELLKKEGLDYKPEVTFELTPDGKLIVSDNGSGMDEDIVENYFAQIGRCFYTSPDFLTQELEFTPVSRFGIGILSCFMVADKLEIETKKEGSEPLLIEIDNTFDYFFVREGRRKDIGTTVTLFLKEEVRKEIEEGEFELEKIVQRYACHLEFHVQVKVPEKEPVVIEDKGHDCDILMKELSLPKLFWHKKHYFKTPDRVYEKTYHAVHINEEDMNGIICISLAPLFLTYPRLRTGEILISKEGIFLDKEIFFPLLVGVFADINIKGDILDLNISRSDILKNEKYDKLKSRLGDWIFKGLKDFFEEFRGTQTPLGRLDFNLLLEKYKIFRPWPDSFINLAREYFDFLVFMKEGICKMKYKELKERKVKIVFIGASYFRPATIKKQFISYLEEIVKSCSGFKEDEFYILDRVEDICIFLGTPPVSDERGSKILDEVPDEILELFSSFFEMEESNNLCEVISPSIKREIKFVKFKNYRTKRFIEDFLVEKGGGTGPGGRIREIYLNAEHKFSKLLTNKRDAILRDKNTMKITENFFKSILKLAKIMSIYKEFRVRGYGESYEGILGNILENQKQLLRWFVEKDLISEEEMRDYELRKEDFPPIWF